MQTKNVDIKTSEGSCDCFVAYPSENGSFSPVILLMDIFGPRKYLHDMAEQLAALGYFVLVPNLFYRDIRAPYVDYFPLDKEKFTKAIGEIRPIYAKWSSDQTVADMPYFMKFFSEQKQVKKGRLGLAGYCMGGSLAIKLAAAYPNEVTAVASFHASRLATDAPDSPHLSLPKIKAEIYVGHADNDEGMPPEQIERFQQALEETPLHYETELYKGAAHGFTMKDLPAYNEPALKRHWKKLAELFSRTL